jgi:hypothetical protein
MTKKLSARAKRRRARLRRDPFGRMAVALGDYLKTVGWSAVVVGGVSVTARDITQTTPGAFGRYEARIGFSGGKFTTPRAGRLHKERT